MWSATRRTARRRGSRSSLLAEELAVILSLRSEGQPRTQAPEGLPDSVLMFDCTDIEQTYAEMAARGVEFPTPPMRMPFGWWALFADNEGTRHALGQWQEQDDWRARHPT